MSRGDFTTSKVMSFLLYLGLTGLLALATGVIFRKSIQKKQQQWKAKVVSRVVSTMINEIDSSLSNDKAVELTVNNVSGIAVLSYNRLGKDQKIFLPYDRSLIRKARNYEITATIKDERVTIVQQPGIPFLITGNHLGASSITIRNMRTGETIDWPLDEVIQYP